MTYKKLLDLIESMSDAQQEMPVIFYVGDCFHYISVLMHVDTDFRAESEDLPIMPEDQPILT